MTTIGQQIYNGMGAAAFVLGFLFVILGVAVAIFLVTYGAYLIAKSSKPKPKAANGREAGRYGGSGNPYQHPDPYGHAPRVGRHMRTGA